MSAPSQPEEQQQASPPAAPTGPPEQFQQLARLANASDPPAPRADDGNQLLVPARAQRKQKSTGLASKSLEAPRRPGEDSTRLRDAASADLPRVSIATCEDIAGRTESTRAEKQKATAGGQSPPSSDSSRRASSTSEVHSCDDAASIASRLSQIVDEQEFLWNHRQKGGASPSGASMTQASSTGDLAGRVSGARAAGPPDGLVGGGLLQRPASSSANHRPAAAGAPSLPTRDTKREPAGLQAGDPLGRSRTKSFAGRAPDRDQSRAAALQARRNESSGALWPPGGQFHPERGDLRSLESSRQSHAAAGKSSKGDLLDQRWEPMLNIRRSAWKLDEFEQAFKPADAEAQHDPAGDSECIRGDPDRQRAPFERSSLFNSSSNRNLLLTSRKIARNQSAGGHADDFVGLPKSASLLASAPAIQEPRRQPSQPDAKHSQEQQSASLSDKLGLPSLQSPGRALDKRRGSGLSIASFASSFDSFQSARRPFGRLATLLSKPRGGGGATSGKRAGRREAEERGDCCSMGCLKQYIPVLEWLPAYEWRRDLWPDVTAGLAVAVLNISTSLSAAVVAETDLGAAFRSSIFNTFVYALLCSSRHSSFGSWSIMSQMLLDSVGRALSDELILSRINLGPQASWNAEEYDTWHMNIIVMYTFLIGLVQLVGGLLNLGNILASFIPEALCSSMIAATAFTMAVGQLANMCGTSNKILWAIEKNTTELAWAELKNLPVSITDLFAGLFRWIQQLALLAKHHNQINAVAVLISLVSLALLIFNQYYFQRKVRRLFNKQNLFIPFEMLLLVAWVCVAYALELRDRHRVATCGPISINFAMPNVPNLRLFRELWFDSLATALISYTMVFIMARTYSNRLNYEINANQELLACGAGNLIGGLFDALPATASFSRTAGQVEAGGRTQMASMVNCVALVVLAQFLGHHVAHLPVCVMSAMLFFGFVRMMARAREAATYWRLCKVDFSIWLFTFVAILTLDLVYGFVYGFIFSILTMLYRAQNRRCYMLGGIGSSDVYVPMAKYPLARELDGIKIFQFCGPIHYVCADLFERLLRQKTRVNVKEIAKAQQQQPQASNGPKAASPRPEPARDPSLPSHIILDFSMISFIDSAGVQVIKKIIRDYERVRVTIMLASLASHVAQVVKSEPSLWLAHKDRFYVTLADAVHHALGDQRAQRAVHVLVISPEAGAQSPLSAAR